MSAPVIAHRPIRIHHARPCHDASISDGWAAFYVGQDGKRRRADFQIPGFIDGDELAQYLDDLFHEDASPARPSVVPLPRDT
ncbi:DUF7661 family protein [Paraburkholderia terrae]|uniref:DUF7661 family protein n=1 Tax=Paraburkholderia terrae TaxID=311230 RepID=UPI00296AD908|nr:hypothetical protein [Paraburkholderia terrae]MDW3656132.1 hypothetical protein [Paraburkholderia terrae]